MRIFLKPVIVVAAVGNEQQNVIWDIILMNFPLIEILLHIHKIKKCQ